MTVIGLIGPKAAGKDMVANYIRDKKNGVVLRFAGILDDILTILGLPITRENEVKLVTLRDAFGENTLPNALAKKIKSAEAEWVIVTAIRFQNEMDFIRSYPNNKVIFVDADLRTRYERQSKRKQKGDDQIAFEKFVETERARTETDIQKVASQADFKIANNGTESDLYAQVDKILQAIS